MLLYGVVCVTTHNTIHFVKMCCCGYSKQHSRMRKESSEPGVPGVPRVPGFLECVITPLGVVLT